MTTTRSQKIATTVFGVLTATVLIAASATSASACPNGYKRVTIQGNSVCMIDHGGPTSLAAPGGGGIKKFAPATRLRRN